MLEGVSREVQACQLNVRAGKGYGTDHLQCDRTAHPGQPGDLSQHRFRKGRSCLTNLLSFYGKVTNLMDVVKAVHVVLSKTFDTISHSILLEKLVSHSLEGCSLDWV